MIILVRMVPGVVRYSDDGDKIWAIMSISFIRCDIWWHLTIMVMTIMMTMKLKRHNDYSDDDVQQDKHAWRPSQSSQLPQRLTTLVTTLLALSLVVVGMVVILPATMHTYSTSIHWVSQVVYVHCMLLVINTRWYRFSSKHFLTFLLELINIITIISLFILPSTS